MNRAKTPHDLRKFAEERSHRDAGLSNENVRATAQASILINGGAATAILAFLAKDRLDPSVLKIASGCMAGYALGVLMGAAMLYCSSRSLDEYNVYWRLLAHPDSERDITKAKIAAYQWWLWIKRCFFGSILLFLFSTAIVSWALYRSTPPQLVPGPSSATMTGTHPTPLPGR
jgi:hypothetical protein